MVNYVVRRVLLMIPVVLAAVTIIFFVFRMGIDPAVAILGDNATKAAVEDLRSELGLDKPLWVQYFSFLGQIAHGDLGRTARSNVPIAPYVAQVIPHTLMLAASGILIGCVFGIALGTFVAVRRNSLIDYVARVFSLIGASIPAFFLGAILIMIFCIRLKILPVVGAGQLDEPLNLLRHLVLPSLTLGLIMTGYVTRVVRSAMLGVLSEEYMQTARAKGLREWTVVIKHAMRNALVPIVAFVGTYSMVLLGNAVTVEIVFSRPGLGRLLIDAAKDRDIITLQSVMIIFAALVVLISLVTDIIYAVVNPRIQYS